MADEKVNGFSTQETWEVITDKLLENGQTKGEKEEEKEKEEEEEEESRTEEEEVESDGVPYDRGWAWAIVLGCFINYAFYAGYVKCYSLFYVELLHRFHANAAQTALFFSMRNGVISISSLFVMNLAVGPLGERLTTLIGGILVALSGILPSLTNQMMAIICLQGICLGLGQSMICSPGEVLMGAYFRKKRSLAMPLAKCGASIGSLAMPLLITFFLQTYSLSGALLLTGGLCLHILPAAMLFRPTSYFRKRKNPPPPLHHHQQAVDNSYKTEDKAMTRAFIPNPFSDEKKNLIPVNPAALSFSVPELSNMKTDPLMTQKPLSLSDLSDQHWMNGFSSLEMEWIITVSNQDIHPKFQPVDSGKLSSSLPSIPELYGKVENGKKEGELECGTVEEESSSTSSEKERCPKCPGMSRFMLDFSLFRRPLFRLLLAFFLVFNAPNIMLSYLPALASENGVSDSQNGVLLSIIGGLDLVCRLLVAFVANSKLLRVPTMIIIAYVILGVASQFTALLTSFYHFLAVSVLMGLLSSVGNALLPVLVLEFVGLQHMGKALGFVLLACGAASAFSFPLLGYIRDVTGSYVVVYHVIGLAGIVGAGLLCLESCVRRFESRHRQDYP